MANRFTVQIPDIRSGMRAFYADILRRQKKAAFVVTDRVSRDAQQSIKAEMQAAGLGRLGGAVKQTSALKRGTARPYGVIYAAGGDDSLAGGALESYSQGSVIRANKGSWIAFQTNVIPRRVGRYRMTPERYAAAGFNTSLGKLEFRPVNSRVAFLIVRNTTQHVRTGRIKLPGVRASRVRVPVKEIVVFVLIKETARAKRFDKDQIADASAAKAPDYADQAMGT